MRMHGHGYSNMGCHLRVRREIFYSVVEELCVVKELDTVVEELGTVVKDLVAIVKKLGVVFEEVGAKVE